MTTKVDGLIAALTAEFSGDVTFTPWIPATVNPPQVIVAPGDPFLAPGTHGMVEENWQILVVTSIKEPKQGIDQMRDLSLRVRKAVHSVGAVWHEAGALSAVTSQTQTVLSANDVTFRYLTTEE